jgi:hypothetical protein
MIRLLLALPGKAVEPRGRAARLEADDRAETVAAEARFRAYDAAWDIAHPPQEQVSEALSYTGSPETSECAAPGSRKSH